jgi:hypothetical protein
MDDFSMEGLTVVDAMVACGIDHNALFQEQTQAMRIASESFSNGFLSCLDITFKDLGLG